MRLLARPLLVLLPTLLFTIPSRAPAQATATAPLPTTATVLLGGRVKLRVEVAVTENEQMRGLSGRPGLLPGTGMLFAYPAPGFRSMWMLGMRFPLDFLWIRDGRIVDLFEQIPRPRPGEHPVTISSPEPAQYILELPAGFIRAHGLSRGDAAEVRLAQKSP